MKKLDRFILSSFLGPFIMTFFLVVFILMMQTLWLYIDELVGKGLGLLVIIEFLGWGAAILIPLALPLATLLASIMTMGSLGENNELLAMKAAGISLPRIMAPLVIVAVLISIGAFFASNNLLPVSYNKIYTLRDDIGKTKEEIKIPIGVFYDGIDGYILRINDRNKKTDMMYDVMVYNHVTNLGNTNLTLADSGIIKFALDMKSIVFTLHNGTSYDETNKISYRDTSLAQQKIKFDKQDIIIPLEDYAFEKSDEGRFSNEIMSKNLEELKILEDSLSTKYDDTKNSHYTRSPQTSSLQYARDFDTTRNKNLNPHFYTKVMYDSLGLQDKIKALGKAISRISNPISSYSSFQRESTMYAHPLRRTQVEVYRKYTLSLACLIFFFIGAPLGAIIRKGGFGTPVIISILFFVLYWVVDISGKKLADDGAIDPWLGTFISSLVLLPIGVFLTYKSTKDSALFNFDDYKLKVEKFFARIQSLIQRITPNFLKSKFHKKRTN